MGSSNSDARNGFETACENAPYIHGDARRKVAGVIVEFNPFHNGHAEHLQLTREITACEKIVAVMSGNFVQRGEPAMCDKYMRTKMALEAGVDIVIEIPVPYATAGAGFFAQAGVKLLAATGVVNALSFGSESGDIAAITAAGKVLATEPQLYKETLREGLGAGKSFAAARGAALEKCVNSALDLFTKPNNCLAMEYCKALYMLAPTFAGNPIEIFTTHRESGGPSATNLRRAFHAGELAPVDVCATSTLIDTCGTSTNIDACPTISNMAGHLPSSVLEILTHARENAETVTLDDFTEIFRFLLYTKNFDLGEGLENRFRKMCASFPKAAKISDFLAAAKTKRYTHTRLQRTILRMILGIIDADMTFYEENGGVQYIRVLGFRKESANLLGEITKKATLPVITHGAAIDEILAGNARFMGCTPATITTASPAAKMLAKELEAGDIYRLASGANGGFRSERASQVVII